MPRMRSGGDIDMRYLADIEQDFVTLRGRLSTPEAILVDPLLNRLRRWHDDDSTVADLIADLDRILGHTWFKSNEDHATAALLIARLRDIVPPLAG
jgi:hypothetical protein